MRRRQETQGDNFSSTNARNRDDEPAARRGGGGGGAVAVLRVRRVQHTRYGSLAGLG